MAEREVNFPAIVRSEETSVLKLAKDDYVFLFKFVNLVLAQYFSFSHPNLSAPKIVELIAADLIETRPTWKAADFVNLCKFFRQNPNLIKTQASMTPEIFVSNVAVYEEHRALEMEKYLNEKRGELQQPGERRFSDDSIKSQLGRMMEATSALHEEKRITGKLSERRIAPDEKYFQREHGINPNV